MRRKKFLSYYRPYLGRFARVLLAALISAAASVLFPLCVRSITAMPQTGFDANALWLTLGVMLALAAIEFICETCYDYFGHSMGAEMENDLRQELFAHLEQQSFAFYDHHRVGELMTSLDSDLNNLAELYHHGPEDYVMNTIKFVGASAILFALDWRLTLVLYLFIPPMAYLTLRLNRRTRKAAALNRENIAEINAHAEEALSGIRVSQIFNRQTAEKARFRQAGEKFVRSRKAIYLAETVEYQALTVLTRLMYVAAIAAGVFGITSGRMLLADLVAFLLYISYLTEPVRSLAWMTTQFQQGLAGFDRAVALLEIKPAIADAPGARELSAVQGRISFENVTFRYGGQTAPVLSQFSLDVKPGECVALVGISGAGKTTVSALIPRFYDPQEGCVKVDGHDVRALTLESLRAAIAVVQQDTYLFSGSVLANIRYSRPQATDEMVHAAARSAGVDAFISALPQGYETDVGPRGVRLSGGQRQRVALARAFLSDAPILILDECSSALDRESERLLQSNLRALRRGRTTLVIAHRLSTILDADRICLVQDGRIIEQGSFEQLMATNGAFARLYRAGDEPV